MGLFLIAGFVSAGATFIPFFRPDPPVLPAAEPPLPPPPARMVEAGLKLPAKVLGDQVRPAIGGRYPSMFWAGVNLGSSVPGQEPGAVAATRPDYDRWFAGMADLGVTVVRVYTILGPAFYDALREFNLKHPTKPIYVLQGIWFPEEQRFYDLQDAWDPIVVASERKEIRDAVAAVSGNAVIEKVPGHASGIYNSDVTPWMMGWSFGIEWDPDASHGTDLKHTGMPPYQGQVLPRQGQCLADGELDRRPTWTILLNSKHKTGWSVPITFTNWDTTDPLHHPAEPLFSEDLVSIDASHLQVTSAWPAGYFVSFHAYPYYPDFLRWQQSYQTYRRPRDHKVDPYAGYIHDLRRYFKGMALMVTEFGQPTSLGCAHRAPLGRDQGCHSEQEAATNVVDMMHDLKDEGVAGGIVFMWLDEWFKFTWNTIDYELPHQNRAMWRSVFTNEEHFGSSRPNPAPATRSSWTARTASGPFPLRSDRHGAVKERLRDSDAENVYLRLKVTPKLWKHKRIVLGLDARPGGNKGLPGLPGVDPGSRDGSRHPER